MAAAVHARALGLDVEAVVYPQPDTDDVARTRAGLSRLGVRVTRVPSPYLMPAGLAARLAALATRRPYLLWPGASTPLGTLGYVSAGLELAGSGIPEPDDVVVPLGSGGTAVGTAMGIALGGWRVYLHRNDPEPASLKLRLIIGGAFVGALLGACGLASLHYPSVAGMPFASGGWVGTGYGAPTVEGAEATARGREHGLTLEPTYTAKAFAAALTLLGTGRRVVFVQTFAGDSAIATRSQQA